MNKRRLKSAEAYSQVQDSYSLPNILSEARSHFGPYGLPLSISVSKLTTHSDFGSKSSTRTKRKKISKPNTKNNPQQSFTNQSNITDNVGDCSNVFRLAAHRMAKKIRGIVVKDPLSMQINLPYMKASTTSYHKGISLRDSITSSFHSINHEKQHVFGMSVDEVNVNQNSSSSFSSSSSSCSMTQYPELKSYTVESETGLVFNVMEIGIPYKKNLWTDVIMKRIHSTNSLEQVLKAIILSQRGASLIWIFNNKTRIILLSENGTADLVTWCSKVLSDIQITRNFLNEQRHLWHPNIQKRLKHAAKNCKILDSLVGQTDASHHLKFTPHFKAANEVFLNSTRCIWHGLADISKNKSNKKSKFGKFSKKEEEGESLNSEVFNDFVVNPCGSKSKTVAVVDSRISLYPGEKTVTKVKPNWLEVIQKWEYFSSKVKGSHQRSCRQIYPLPVYSSDKDRKLQEEQDTQGEPPDQKKPSSRIFSDSHELDDDDDDDGDETTASNRENKPITISRKKSLCNHSQEKTRSIVHDNSNNS